jgi:hypothetical protein
MVIMLKWDAICSKPADRIDVPHCFDASEKILALRPRDFEGAP